MRVQHSLRERGALVLVGLLLANSAIIFAFKGADFLYLTNVLLHLGLGLAATLAFLVLLPRLVVRLRCETNELAQLLGVTAAGLSVVALTTGGYLLVVGALRPQQPVLRLHLSAAIGATLAGALYFILRARNQGGRDYHLDRWLGRVSACATAVFVFLPAITVTARAALPSASKGVTNPRWAPGSPDTEGDGKGGKFFPSSVQTVNDLYFPSEYYIDSKSCGAKGCHPDIVKQWESSAHRLSSFNNQWYRKSIEYMQDVNGVESSKWCGGCHDMAVLQTEKPGTGKSRMDFPIKDQLWPPEKFPEAHAGIGCAACHSIVHVKSTMGQGDFRADYPPMHKYAISQEPMMKFLHDFLIRRAPEPHRATFLKPLHREDTAKFCSSCHKVHLDVPVNNYRWFRGFNDYDAWQNSGVSGGNARAFYYPKDGFKKCVDCHMVRVPSTDAGNKDGFVKSHRFLAANTALPFVNDDHEQLALTTKFLQNGPEGLKPPGVSPVTVDVFAIRRPAKSSNAKKPSPNTGAGGPARPPWEAGRESTMLPDESGTLTGSTLKSQKSDWSEPELIDGKTTIAPGETVLVEVVARTRKVGHFFPGGTVDGFDVWLELEGRDATGRKLFHSGALEFPDGPIKPDAHEYRSLMLDAKGNRINKRNAWASRVVVYVRLIPPGAADTAHFRFTAPRDARGPFTFTARMNYRKFDWWNTQFAFRGRPKVDPRLQARAGVSDAAEPDVTKHYDSRDWAFDADASTVSGKLKDIPKLPIVVVASDQKNVPSPTPDSRFPLAERWNDYGIGLFLQRDFRTAELAFRQVIALDPQWPEGYVNAARVKHDEGDLNDAIVLLKRALALHEKLALNPNRSKVHYFLGSSLFQLGEYEPALANLATAMAQFPDDRVVRNLIGTIHFRRGEFGPAIREFEHVLTIDPEDLQAHYHLMLCYKGRRELGKSARHEKMYKRFKADESATRIVGPYLQTHPHDNNEARLIHDHGG